MSGAQPTEQLLAVLERAWSERQPLTMVGVPSTGGAADGDACGPDGCPVRVPAGGIPGTRPGRRRGTDRGAGTVGGSCHDGQVGSRRLTALPPAARPRPSAVLSARRHGGLQLRRGDRRPCQAASRRTPSSTSTCTPSTPCSTVRPASTEMFARTAELGMDAIAMTDHGNVFGAYDFYSKATAAGVKPIIGMEAYLTPNTSRFDRKRVRWNNGGDDDVSGSGAYTHMTLLAENNRGMHNLFRLSSALVDRGLLLQAARRPRAARRVRRGADRHHRLPVGRGADLAAHRRLRQGPRRGRRLPGHLRPGQLLPRADGPRPVDRDPGARRPAPAVARTSASRRSRPTTRTTPTPTTRPPTSTCSASPRAARWPTRSGSSSTATATTSSPPAEMRELWGERNGLPEACDNTLLIAERCDVAFDESANYMPRFPVPEGETEDTWFVKEVEKGLRLPLPRRRHRPRSASRPTSRSASSPRWASRATSWSSPTSSTGPRTTASGSAPAVAPAPARWRRTPCGSPTSTRSQHGLIFERFLNPDRVSMPDFDIDFDERRRGEVIRYVSDKYGDDRVSMIVTYGTIKAKQAVKDSSRILGYPFAMGDRITKAMPAAVMGKDVPLKEIFDQRPQALRRGRRVPLAVRRRRRRQEGRRHRHRHRGPQAAVGRARRRRDHVQRAAAGRHPGDAAASRTARSSRSSTTRPASASA